MKKIDTRGYSCPEPVIMTQIEVQKGEDELEIITDTTVSRENVLRFLQGVGFTVDVESSGDDHILRAKK
ncbi:MAG: sulfurtransferase TusA family protein [Tissierellia bacterium]|nr:sulfurtransferase TusA family protein [Tissierellia bacterium]